MPRYKSQNRHGGNAYTHPQNRGFADYSSRMTAFGRNFQSYILDPNHLDCCTACGYQGNGIGCGGARNEKIERQSRIVDRLTRSPHPIPSNVADHVCPRRRF